MWIYIYIYFYLDVILYPTAMLAYPAAAWSRGDWTWLKETWNLKHWWRHRKGICFKCLATATPGPHVWLVCILTPQLFGLLRTWESTLTPSTMIGPRSLFLSVLQPLPSGFMTSMHSHKSLDWVRSNFTVLLWHLGALWLDLFDWGFRKFIAWF